MDYSGSCFDMTKFVWPLQLVLKALHDEDAFLFYYDVSRGLPGATESPLPRLIRELKDVKACPEHDYVHERKNLMACLIQLRDEALVQQVREDGARAGVLIRPARQPQHRHVPDMLCQVGELRMQYRTQKALVQRPVCGVWLCALRCGCAARRGCVAGQVGIRLAPGHIFQHQC
jgi:hypothetical protein